MPSSAYSRYDWVSALGYLQTLEVRKWHCQYHSETSQIPQVEGLGWAPAPWNIRVSQGGKAQGNPHPRARFVLRRLRDTARTLSRTDPVGKHVVSTSCYLRVGQCVDGHPRATPITRPAMPPPTARRAALNKLFRSTPELTKQSKLKRAALLPNNKCTTKKLADDSCCTLMVLSDQKANDRNTHGTVTVPTWRASDMTSNVSLDEGVLLLVTSVFSSHRIILFLDLRILTCSRP